MAGTAREERDLLSLADGISVTLKNSTPAAPRILHLTPTGFSFPLTTLREVYEPGSEIHGIHLADDMCFSIHVKVRAASTSQAIVQA